jgi:hypothetical protein
MLTEFNIFLFENAEKFGLPESELGLHIFPITVKETPKCIKHLETLKDRCGAWRIEIPISVTCFLAVEIPLQIFLVEENR